ncbi:oxidoreductase molybdopterin binding protein [Flammeovirgaceae bacterium 311]|nr:oxidoreductase molybdopterin binding protein [Flammeovirgaceae bacterium 311]
MKENTDSDAGGIKQEIKKIPQKGPFRRDYWRSPLRGPWMASFMSLLLLIVIPIVFITGLIDHVAWNPDLGGTNNRTPEMGLLGFLQGTEWPTRPIWLYRLTEGTHVVLGITLLPLVLAKLWAIMPSLYKWPLADSLGHALERISLLFVIGGIFFQIFTGLFYIQNFIILNNVTFNRLHFYGNWIFIAGLVLHVLVKFPEMIKGLKGRDLDEEMSKSTDETEPEPEEEGRLVSTDPAPPTISRRGAIAIAGGSALTIMALAVGQTLGRDWSWLAILSPRAQSPAGDGPNDFRVNKTAKKAKIQPEQVGPDWRLELVGATTHSLSREDLLAMPLHTSSLPISCLEGWSTGNQSWEGVRLRDLAVLAGMPNAGKVLFESLESTDAVARMSFMRHNQIQDPLSLLALRVNGADLSMDHGYPARAIVPATPGNRNTKWIYRMTFMEEA